MQQNKKVRFSAEGRPRAGQQTKDNKQQPVSARGSVAAAGRRPKDSEPGGDKHKQKGEADKRCTEYAARTSALQQEQCTCSAKCSGPWSGFHCKVPYGRFLTLREKFLTNHHHSRPDSGSYKSTWSVLEFMCGVAALSAIWAALGVIIGGLCEQKHHVLDAVSNEYAVSNVYSAIHGNNGR